MNKNFLLAVLLLVFWNGFSQKKVMHVVLLAGQSNMQGHGNYDALDGSIKERIKKVSSRVLLSTSNNEKVDAKPLSYYTAKKSEKYPFTNHFGPELFIGLTLAEANPNQEYLLIKKAVGGTSLYGAWSPEWTAEKAKEAERGKIRQKLQLFNEHMSNIHAQLSKLKKEKISFEIIGLAWMQGEGDTNKNSTASTYEANLRKLIAAYRKEINIPKLPFVMGQINVLPRKFKDGPSFVRTAMMKVANSDKLVDIIQTRALAPWTDFPKHSDNLHYNVEGQKRLGIAFGRLLLSLNK